MNVNNIPSKIHHLIPFALQWGIGDDAERDIKIENSAFEDLETLVQSINADDADVLDNWLSGLEATTPPFSTEYITFTCFLMAYDYAKVILKQNKN